MIHNYIDEDTIDVESLEIDYPDDGDDVQMYFTPEPQYENSVYIDSPINIIPDHPPIRTCCKYNITCSICLCSIKYENLCVLSYCEYQCGQVFHRNCIQLWHKDTCPICRHNQKPDGSISKKKYNTHKKQLVENVDQTQSTTTCHVSDPIYGYMEHV